MRPGTRVLHPEHGPGRVVEVLGDTVKVSVFGEVVNANRSQLTALDAPPAPVEDARTSPDRVMFRRAFEALNLGVVSPNPDQLVAFSIRGPEVEKQAIDWLDESRQHGLSKVVFGDYGAGKSHFLRLVESAALRRGWVVSFVEFDPKEADPAKPHLVYRAIMRGLRFPKRNDGSQCRSFFDLVGEVRRRWVDVRDGRYFRLSEWFEPALNILRHQPHADDALYRDGVEWLAGAAVPQTVMAQLASAAGGQLRRPARMPRARETAEIYVSHLVVVNEWCRELGYEGLLILLDEAEHVRGFSVNRQDRATNFFDLLARAANPPLEGAEDPFPNEHGFNVPNYWLEGPHFGVVVALTEGDIFRDRHRPLRDACAFLHRNEDMLRLQPATEADYQEWCVRLLTEFVRTYPTFAELIADPAAQTAVAALLAQEYGARPPDERTMRLWTKLASLVPALLFAGRVQSLEELSVTVTQVARQACGREMPWEMAW